MSLVPLTILLGLGGSVLAAARLARNTKRQREGFSQNMASSKNSKATERFSNSVTSSKSSKATERFLDLSQHDSATAIGQERYNPLTNLMDIMSNPFVGPTAGPQDIKNARKDIQGVFRGVVANPPSAGAPMIVGPGLNTLNIPSDTKGMRTYAVQKCEKVISAQCSAFDDPEFAKNCGICFKPGTDSQAQNRIGGLFLDTDDKTATELQSQVLGEKRVNYRPTVGTCPPGFFVVDRTSCDTLQKRLDCEQKKTYSIAGCSQCYSDGSYTIVDASVPRADLSLAVNYIGNLTVTLTGSTSPIATASSNALGDKIIPLGYIPESSTIIITVDGPGAVLGGYIQGPTINGVFQIELAQLADADLESGGRPRMSGELIVGGNSVIALKPGRGKLKMSLRVQVPMTFVDVGEYEASTCPAGPFLTKESSAKVLAAGTCFKPGNTPGSYSLDCLQEKFIELGCTTDGTGYPSDSVTATALNKTPDGSTRHIGNIADLIYENSLKATTGVSSAGVKQTLSQWNDASKFCTGKEILNACDAVAMTGTMTAECMGDLWSNKGANNRLGGTYTSTSQSASLTGRKDRYCTTNGLLAPYGPDGKPQQDAIKRAFNAGGTIQDIKELYDRTHLLANNNSAKDADRVAAIKDCYGVSLNMSTLKKEAIGSTGQDLKTLKGQYDAIIGDLTYLYGLGLGPGSGNATFDDRYAKKQVLDKQVLLPIRAQYVRILPTKNGSPEDRCLQISQLQVFNSAGQEVARGRPTSSASTFSMLNESPSSSKAVDGNAAPRAFPNIYHDECNTNGQNQFWMVDLGSEQDLSSIIYYNRTDCCGNRADGMPVQLLDSSMNVVGQTIINGSAPKIQINFTIFDKQNIPWNNLA